MPEILTYEDVRRQSGLSGGKTVHLLLGNGFSMGCDSVFNYRNLGNDKGLSPAQLYDLP